MVKGVKVKVFSASEVQKKIKNDPFPMWERVQNNTYLLRSHLFSCVGLGTTLSQNKDAEKFRVKQAPVVQLPWAELWGVELVNVKYLCSSHMQGI